MSKFAIAAVVTAVAGGSTLLVTQVMRGGDAHAAKSDASTTTSAEERESCLSDFLRVTARASSATKPSTAAVRAFAAPSLASASSAPQANDCATVGRHLAELEADATHGPEHRPDEATCEKCASHYTTACETQQWSEARRTCSLAAGDLMNAQLCAGQQLTGAAPPAQLAPELQCGALGQHIMTTVHAAGIYTDVKDMAQQVEAACTLGGWVVELRQCFAAATTVPALQACVVNDD